MTRRQRVTTPEERAYTATRKFVRELFKALDLDHDLDPKELEKEIQATTFAVVESIDARLRERLGTDE